MILVELTLTFVVVLIMFAALALAKMDCHNLANYFLLPALFGVVYANSSIYQRLAQDLDESANFNQPNLTRMEIENMLVITNKNGLVDSIELALGLGLGSMILLQFSSNLLGRKSSKAVRLFNGRVS